MQIPLQVRFHGLPPSHSVAREVAHRVRELETDFPRIVSCRVAIALPHRHRQQGRCFRVRVDLGMPGRHAIAGRIADADPAHADVYVAIRDAFRAARRQLEQQVGRRREWTSQAPAA
jgi:ribosome-associated translation inhibitor RaiA